MDHLKLAENPLFTIPLLILLIMVIALLIFSVIILASGSINRSMYLSKIKKYLHSIGTFAIVFGILGQLLGIYGAFQVIGGAKSVNPDVWMAGIINSMSSTLFGFFIFILTRCIGFGIRYFLNKQN